MPLKPGKPSNFEVFAGRFSGQQQCKGLVSQGSWQPRYGVRLKSALLTSLLFTAVLLAAPLAPAIAQEAVTKPLNDVRNALGFGQERAPIDFTERPPLVVPPTNNLPPPGQDTATLGVNDPDIIARRKALADSRRPVPPSDPGSNAPGLSARPYLVDPPSGMRDPDAVAASITTDPGAPEGKASPRRHHTRKRTPAPAAEQ